MDNPKNDLDTENSEHRPRKQFCVQCRKNTMHRYVHRSWTCAECGKDEWL